MASKDFELEIATGKENDFCPACKKPILAGEAIYDIYGDLIHADCFSDCVDCSYEGDDI